MCGCGWVCVVFQVVYEVAFNSARGGYVAIDDISFSPEFCHTDTGEGTGGNRWMDR